MAEGNIINLATMWIPIMPETSQMEAKARESGEKVRQRFEEGFGSGSSGTQLGSNFADQVVASFTNRFKNSNIFGGNMMAGAFEKMTAGVDDQLASKLETKLPQAYKAVTAAQADYTAALQRAQPYIDREAEATEKITALKAAHAEQSAISTKAFEEATAARGKDNAVQSDWIDAQMRGSDAAAKANELLGQRRDLERQLDYSRAGSKQRMDELTEAQSKASAAQSNYTDLVTKHDAATKSALNSTTLLAGITGGALVLGVQAVTGAFREAIELGEHVFEGAVEGAKELADKLVEVGEDYQHLNIQVSEFSSASGAQLDSLQSSAAKVFNGLDVSGENTGQTLATLSSRLGLVGKPLEDLTTRVERLQGRFKDLKPNDVATAFMALQVSGAQANDTLASWVDSAQAAGVSTGALVAQLSAMGENLRPDISGLSPEQLGKWFSLIEQKVPNGQKIIMGLMHAEQEFQKHGWTFAQGMAEVQKAIANAGTDAQKEQIAFDAFGARGWSGAMDAAKLYQQVVAAGPDAVRGNASALDELLEKWSDIGNKIEEFKHKVEGVAAPFGKMATDVVEGGLKKISKWFEDNQVEIIDKIQSWGDKLIGMLPKIKEWAAISVRIISDLAAAVTALLFPLAETMLGMGAAALAISGNFGEAKDMLGAMAKFSDLPFDIAGKGNAAADKIEAYKIPTDGITSAFDDAADSARNLAMGLDKLTAAPQDLTDAGMPKGGTGHGWWWGNAPKTAGPGRSVTQPNSGGSGAPGSPGPPPVNPSTPAPGFKNPLMPPPSDHFDTGAGGLPGFPGAPSSFSSSGASDFPGGVNWPAIAGAESSGDWTIDHGEGNDVTGAFQISTPTWISHGGGQYAPKAYMAPPEAQLEVAEAILADPSQGPKAWPQTFANHPDWFGSYGQSVGYQRPSGGGQRVVGVESGGFASGLGFKVPGATEGANPYAPYGSFREWLEAKNLGMSMGMWAAENAGKQSGGLGFTEGGDIPLPPWTPEKIARLHEIATEQTGIPYQGEGKQFGGIPGATEGANPYAPYGSFREWLEAKNLGMSMGMWAAENAGKQSGGLGFTDGGDIPLPPWTPEKIARMHEIATAQTGIAYEGEGKESGGKSSGGLSKLLNRLRGNKTRMAGNVINSGDPDPTKTGPYDTGPQIPKWWHTDESKLQKLAGLGGWDDAPSIGGPGDKSRIWWQHSHDDFAQQGREAGGRGPKDTVPIWVTPNEYIWNDEAVSKYGWLIHPLNEEAQGRGTGQMSRVRETLGLQAGGNPFTNAKSFGQGGAAGGQGGVGQVIWSNLEDPSVQAAGGDAGEGAINGHDASGGPGSTYSDETNPGGQGFAGHHGHVHTTFNANPFTGEPYAEVPAGSNINPGESGFPDWVYQLGSMYNLRPATYAGHQEWDGVNHGIDWWPQDAWDLSGQKNTHEDNVTLSVFADSAIQVSSGAGGFDGGSGDGTSALDNSTVYSNAAWGGGPHFSNAGNGERGGGHHGGGSYYGMPGAPGMPGGPGFPTDPTQMTPEQFKLWDEQRGREKEIRGKQDAITDLEKERDKLQNDTIPKAKKKYDDAVADPIKNTPEDIAALKDAWQQAVDRLSKIVDTKIPEAKDDLAADKVKAQQPIKTGTGKEDDGAKDFGSKFLGGVAQSLGFPDVFGGKAPWDFGIVKSLGRFATGFMNGMKQEGGAGPGGGAGIPGIGGGGLGGMLNGLGGSLGIPNNAFQGGTPHIAGGPNVYNTAPDQKAPGPGGATTPGAGAIHIGDVDNSVNVHPATDAHTVSAIQSYQNSYGRAQGIASSPSFHDIPSTPV